MDPVRIAIYVFDGISTFHLAIPQMVFGEVARQQLADWSTVLFTDHAGSVTTAEGQEISPITGPGSALTADIVVVPSWFDDGRVPARRLQELLLDAHRRGAVVAGLCLGAFPVADTGLLDGRSAVTHWYAADLLAARRKNVEIDASVLYIDHGDVITSAGTASGIDACLHLVRTRLGTAAANSVARSLVIAPHREGGQAQYVERPLPARSSDDPMSQVLDWAIEHLDEPLTVDDLARRARMSRRTFVRAFRVSTGTTPASWVTSKRLDEARRLLEQTDLPIERVARLVGYSSAITFRQNFSRAFATTPTSYRRRFGTA
ncbi:GlxA family transcriptional regulator [Brachybacterium saurashtrense]|nr:helix-turn-helix domain-containing protein [Brachybacterium saurashtrense]